MHCSITVPAIVLLCGLSACAGPRADRGPSDSTAVREHRLATSATALQDELDRLYNLGDVHAMLAFVDLMEPKVRSSTGRARLGLARARGMLELNRNFSALTSFDAAWQRLSPAVNGLANDILVEWADAEMKMGQPKRALGRYEQALEARSLDRDRRRRLEASVVVACLASGDTRRAEMLVAELDRMGRAELEHSAVRLMPLRRTGGRTVAVAVERPIRLGAIPDDPQVILGGIRRRAEWGARPIRPDHVPMAHVSSITIHHSAMDAPTPYGTMAQLHRIQDEHTQGRGWADVGYHFLIDPQGQVWEGRRLLFQGAHAGGAANIGNVGVCLLGNFETHAVPYAQLRAMDDLVASLRIHFRIPAAQVRTHREWKATACPGSELHAAVLAYRSGTRPSLATVALQ
jgi:hypothetical protein